MKPVIVSSIFLFFCFINVSAQGTVVKPNTFTEGVVYSRTTFPGHALQDVLKTISFEKGESDDRNKVIHALKNHQQSIAGADEQGVKDVFFVSSLMLIPIHSELYHSPSKNFIRTFAIGYHQETLINQTDHTGKMVISDRENTNQGTIDFHSDDMKEVWQKYKIDEAQYSIQRTNETAVIAGYSCKKIIYTFGGTSRGPGITNYVINMLPQKVTAWYTDDLDPSINSMHFLDFEMKKAVMKFEAEYDKNKKNKMLVEVVKVEPKKLDDEAYELKTILPLVQHKKNSYEAGTLFMQVMINSISLLTK